MWDFLNIPISVLVVLAILIFVVWEDEYMHNRQVFVLWRIKYLFKRNSRGFREISESSFFGISKNSGVDFHSSGKPEEVLCFRCSSKLSLQRALRMMKSYLEKQGYSIEIPSFSLRDDRDAFIARKGKNAYRLALMMSSTKNPHRKFLLNIKWIH